MRKSDWKYCTTTGPEPGVSWQADMLSINS